MTDNTNTSGNIQRDALFSVLLRQRLAEQLKIQLNNRDEKLIDQEYAERTIANVENVLCTEIVRAVRSFVVKFATNLGEKLGSKIVGE